MDTSRIDGVKAPQHFKTRRSHLLGRRDQFIQAYSQTILEGPDLISLESEDLFICS